jgi:hypothetical protein
MCSSIEWRVKRESEATLVSRMGECTLLELESWAQAFKNRRDRWHDKTVGIELKMSCQTCPIQLQEEDIYRTTRETQI